jgi:hypothetical protein
VRSASERSSTRSQQSACLDAGTIAAEEEKVEGVEEVEKEEEEEEEEGESVDEGHAQTAAMKLMCESTIVVSGSLSSVSRTVCTSAAQEMLQSLCSL